MFSFDKIQKNSGHKFLKRKAAVVKAKANTPKPCLHSKLMATAVSSGLNSLISFCCCCSIVRKTQWVQF